MIAATPFQEVKHRLQMPNLAALNLKISTEYVNIITNQSVVKVGSRAEYLDLAGSDTKEARIVDIIEGHVKNFHFPGLKLESPKGSFEPFPKLPLEIRRQIWGMAITHILPRCIKVVEHPNISGSSDLVIHGAPCPSLLTTCREIYDDVFVTKTYRPMFQMIGSSKSVYFNPKLDIVELTAKQLNIGPGPFQQFHPHLVFSQRLVNPKDATEALENIRISADLMQLAEKWVVKNIDTLGNLKNFALGGTSPFARSISLPLHPVRFFFEQIPDGIFNHLDPDSGPDVVPFFLDDQDQYFRGVDAMVRIRDEVQDIRETRRLSHIWHMMNRIVKETRRLPRVFEAQFHYIHE